MTQHPNSSLTIMKQSHHFNRRIDLLFFVVVLLIFCSRMFLSDRLHWQSESGLRLLRSALRTEATAVIALPSGDTSILDIVQEQGYSIGLFLFGRSPLSPIMGEALLLALLGGGGYLLLKRIVKSAPLAGASVVCCAILPEWNLLVRGATVTGLGLLSWSVFGVLLASWILVRSRPQSYRSVLPLVFFFLFLTGWRAVQAVRELPTVGSALNTVGWIERTRGGNPVVLVTYDSSQQFMNYLNALLLLQNIPVDQEGVRYVLTMEPDALLPVQDSVITAFDQIRIARRIGYER